MVNVSAPELLFEKNFVSCNASRKIESYHRSMKNVLLLEHYYSPDELREHLSEWVEYYNRQRYHESLAIVRPADAYWSRQN